jgi:PAS domain S-box-containing protein
MSSSLTLLIVDNDLPLSAAAAGHLSEAGYTVHRAVDANQGLKIANECLPSLIILNPDLPDMTRQESVREIRSNPRFKHMAILHWGGADDPLEDDISPNPLERSVEDWLERQTPPRRIPVRVRSLLRQVELTEGLRTSEARAATVFRSSPVAIAITTVQEGRFIEVNDRYCKLLGYSRAELMQQTVPGLRLWARLEDRAPVMDKLLESPNLLEVDTRFRRKDGQLLDVIISLSLVELAGESERVLLAQFSDVTQRRTAEKLAKENRDFLRMASRISRLGAWRVDLPQGNVTWSEAVCAIHEVPAGSHPTLEEAFNYIAPESRESVDQAINRCSRDGTSFDTEFLIVTATNRKVWVRSLGEAIRDVDGNITGIQGAIQDIDASKLNPPSSLGQAAFTPRISTPSSRMSDP